MHEIERAALARILQGPYLADCPQCLDLPRRFGSDSARIDWARAHRALTGHAVAVSTDDRRGPAAAAALVGPEAGRSRP